MGPGATPCATRQSTALRLRALALSAAVQGEIAGRELRVRATHRHGASLSLPGSDDPIFLGAPGSGLLPAHIVVRSQDLLRLRRALESTAAARGADLRICIEPQRTRIFRPRLQPGAADLGIRSARRNLAAVARWLRAHPAALGLGATPQEMFAPAGRWMRALAMLQQDAQAAQAALRTLIGYGAGSTPAGDDVVIGALAHAWVRRGEEAPALAAMRALAATLPTLTTGVSASYLRAAIRGEFGAHLISWIRALPRVAPPRALALAQRVAAHGASSGCDTLAGFIAAAAADFARAAPDVKRAPARIN